MQQGETEPSLSLGQERSWFIDQYVDAPVEVLVEQVRLRGPLRAATLAAALGDVVAAEAVLGLAIGTAQGRADRRSAAPVPAALAARTCPGCRTPNGRRRSGEPSGGPPRPGSTSAVAR